MKKIIPVFCFLLVAIGLVKAFASSSEADLRGTLLLELTNGQSPEKLSPGNRITPKAQIRNSGKQTSLPGAVFVRFAYPAPFEKEKGSVLYLSETTAIPALEPGKDHTLSFSTPQQLPTLYEFVRDDWGMRKYEVVYVQDGKETIIADLPLTFSAYYYTGPNAIPHPQ